MRRDLPDGRGMLVPDTINCPRCRTTGFVRVEHVLKAGQSAHHYYCGACEHSWVQAEDGATKADLDPAPDRSRPDELPSRDRRTQHTLRMLRSEIEGTLEWQLDRMACQPTAEMARELLEFEDDQPAGDRRRRLRRCFGCRSRVAAATRPRDTAGACCRAEQGGSLG